MHGTMNIKFIGATEINPYICLMKSLLVRFLHQGCIWMYKRESVDRRIWLCCSKNLD